MAAALNWTWLLSGPEPSGSPLAAIQASTSTRERDQVLDGLAEQALGDDLSALNLYAAGLACAGYIDRAREVWGRVPEDAPEAIWAAINLATCQMRDGQFDATARMLLECQGRIEEGTALRQLIERRLGELGEAWARRERERRLMELRSAAIRERIERGLVYLEELKDLVRIVGRLMQIPDSGLTSRDVLAAAELVHASAPADPEGLEFLALGLLTCEEHDRIPEVLLELEQKAPHSQILAQLRKSRTEPDNKKGVAKYLTSRKEAIDKATEGDLEAEAELRFGLQIFPNDVEARVALLFGAFNRGDLLETRHIADELAADSAAGYYTHVHVAQFYWHLGEHDAAKHHFLTAFRLAENEADRDSVREAIRAVGAWKSEADDS
ncbi:tetratricopeptide repeat protein [Sphaerisporangium aureirubrum]|uniref:Tetratricopeptide repeat protein n=1 Tax=Sphaerisporangium aureirubrum TaxID=1544736 RepID=A0ABW1NMF1_9ACTN